MNRKKLAIKAGFLMILLLGYCGLLWRLIGTEQLSPVAVGTAINAIGWYGPILYVAIYSLRPFFFFPAIILMLAGGMAFGPLWGTVYVVVGACAGASLCFYTARYFGRDKFSHLLSKYSYLEILDGQFTEHGIRTLFVMRLALPYDPVSYTAGLSGMRFRDYILGTFIGTIPGAFAYNFLGYSLHQLFTPDFYLALGLVITLWCSPVVYRFVKRRGR